MSLYRRISNLFSRSHVDREIADELRSHLDMRTEENTATRWCASAIQWC
jgi:hypothetical protein